MNTNWSKILLFSLLSFALGFAICCMCCHHGCGGGSCGHGAEMGMACEHGGGGGCVHGDGGSCMHGGEGKMSCCKGGHGEGHGEDHGVHAIVMSLKDANFQGDTTIAIDGGTVNVHRDGDKMEVKVEMRDSTGKTVTEEVEVTH